MRFSSWLRNRPASRTPAGRASAHFRPCLEALDKRLVPSTLTVTNNLGFGPGSLRDEIAAAQSGDTIVFARGIGSTIFTGPAGSNIGSRELEINKNLDIEGPGAGKLAITGGFGSRVFEVDAGAQVTLSGLTIENGIGVYDPSFSDPNDGKGGGILNLGTLVVSNCIVTGNQNLQGFLELDLGGGIYNAGTLTLSSSTVTNNTASYGGGIFNDTTGMLTVLQSTVTHNTADLGGADLFNLGTWSADSRSKIGKLGP